MVWRNNRHRYRTPVGVLLRLKFAVGCLNIGTPPATARILSRGYHTLYFLDYLPSPLPREINSMKSILSRGYDTAFFIVYRSFQTLLPFLPCINVKRGCDASTLNLRLGI